MTMEENMPLSDSAGTIDIKTYKIANRRANFKKHAALYALVLIVLWLLYIFIFKNNTTDSGEMSIFLKCTLFVTCLWTVIIFFHYLFVYRLNNTLIDKEIKKLQKEIKAKEAQLQTLQARNSSLDSNNEGI